MRSSKQEAQRRAKINRAAAFAGRPIGRVKQAIQPRGKTDRAASFARRPAARVRHQTELDTAIFMISEAIQEMGFALDAASVAIMYYVYDPEPEESLGTLARAKENLTHAIKSIEKVAAEFREAAVSGNRPFSKPDPDALSAKIA